MPALNTAIMDVRRLIIILSFCLLSSINYAQDTVHISLLLTKPETYTVHVTISYTSKNKNTVLFKMPQWTTGYYQIMNYAERVTNFNAVNNAKQPLKWSKKNSNTWLVEAANSDSIILNYDVFAGKAFVAESFIDTSHAYITPAATFMYPDKEINTPVLLNIKNYDGWSRIATGLDSITGKTFTYTAPDFDFLYDCPILAGNLEELPSFTVHGIPHRFIGYKMGSFNKAALMNDIKRIVESSVHIFGDIPYKHYTFLAIGPGNGGVEHLTSSALSFDGNSLHTDAGRKKTLSFIAHEYFHHYNVKRIRPVELGPFDYDNGSKTRQLWIAEGWTVYYEYIILHRAGLITDSDLYNNFREAVLAYETQPGRHFQSLSQASEETWSDGPFGRKGDEVNKTISYYDKGPIVALMLDFAIRHYTQNKKSLDDVMRALYNKFYKEQNRGFTEDELRQTCEAAAGTSLNEIFSYVYTTGELNYTKYFNYGGLAIDTVTHILPGCYTGISGKMVNDTFVVAKAGWQSPAWAAGIRSGAKITSVNNKNVSDETFKNEEAGNTAGATIMLSIIKDKRQQQLSLILAHKTERTFLIAPLPNANALQQHILTSWLKE